MILNIKEIIEVKPFKIHLLFSNNESREIDFETIFKTENPESVFLRLNNSEVFKQVKLDAESKTIYWEGLAFYIDYDGKIKPGPLDIAPEFLYEISKPVSSEKIYH